MSEDPVLIGLDVGTTNVKAIAFTSDGQMVASASAPTPTQTPQPGWAHYDPDALWSVVANLLHELTSIITPERVAGIAIASMGEAAVPLDRDNHALYPMIAWFDPRTKPQVDWLDERIGKDPLFQVTGLSLQPIFGLCKLLWIKQNEPELFGQTVRWLNVADYIAFRLCGEQATDYSLASRTLALNIHEQAWAADVLEASGIPQAIFAPLVASGTALGQVTAEAAEQTGLPETAIVAAGGHDHVCGAFAAGVTQPGMVLNSMGTTETVFLTLDAPLTDSSIGRRGFTQGMHVVPDKRYILGATYSSGGSVDWFRRNFADSLPHETLIEAAKNVAPGSQGACFLPYLQFASPPYDDPHSRGTFVGLSAEMDRSTLFRAVLEGIAYDSRQMLEAMLAMHQVPALQSVYAFGGGTRNPVLMNIKATVLNRPVHVMEIGEATCLGAAMLAGMGAGIYADVAQARETVNVSAHEILPDEESVALYESLYTGVYRKLYDTLKPLHDTIVAIQEKETH